MPSALHELHNPERINLNGKMIGSSAATLNGLNDQDITGLAN